MYIRAAIKGVGGGNYIHIERDPSPPQIYKQDDLEEEKTHVSIFILAAF